MIVGLSSASEGFFETKPPHSNEQLLRFVRRVTSLGFGAVQIVGHLYQIRIELSGAVHSFAGRLLDVHLHDAMRDRDYRKATHLPLGRGTINFPHFIRLLREVGYDGWLTLEVRGSEKEILESKKQLEKLI